MQRIAAGAGIEARAQIGPGLAQRVFVERRGSALARHGQNALGRHRCHGTCQAGLPGRVAAATSVKVELHIHHGDDGAFHQPDLGAVGFGPVLDGQQRPCRISTKQGSSAYQ